MNPPWDGLLLDCRLATLGNGGAGVLDDAALGWKDGRIAFAGPAAALPGEPGRLGREVGSAGGRLVTPGLIDCHTHLVFAGDRAGEFEARLEGASYAEIAQKGGGILSTVRATRAASEAQLLAESLPRARALVDEGVTTLEIKSGYGLDLESERRMLRVARQIGEALGISVRTSALPAHALPPEYAGRADEYVDLVCDGILPALAAEGLADAVDAFCEGIAFTPAQTARVFDTAQGLGLPVKLHADQLSDSGGAALAARYGALSAEHLEYASEDGIRAMAAAGTVAVLLPGAFYALREERPPPLDTMRRAGTAMAIATDLNPGTSPMLSLRLAMGMACTLLGMTPGEALRGATEHAARALGLDDRGRLEPGLRADFVIWNAATPAELCYWIGGNLAGRVVAGGRTLAGRDAD